MLSGLKSALAKYAPKVDAAVIVSARATGFRGIKGVDLDNCVLAYNSALTAMFYLCAAGCVVAFFAAFGMEWRSVKTEQGAGQQEDHRVTVVDGNADAILGSEAELRGVCEDGLLGSEKK